EHIVGCCISEYAKRSICIRAELTHSIRQARRKVLCAINVEQPRSDRRKATMVRPRLAENRMHPAVPNRLTYGFKAPKSFYAPVVPNQQPRHFMGNSQFLKHSRTKLSKAHNSCHNRIHSEYCHHLLLRV